jgi:hypothetical protein
MSVEWKVFESISEQQVVALSDAFSPALCKSLLASYFSLPEASKDASEAENTAAEVMLDYYFYNYAFCKDLGFTAKKCSTFLSMMKAVIDVSFFVEFYVASERALAFWKDQTYCCLHSSSSSSYFNHQRQSIFLYLSQVAYFYFPPFHISFSFSFGDMHAFAV